MATQTLQNLIDDVNSHLDEPVAYRYYTQTELTRWLNEGARDIARRAEILPRLDQTVTAVAGTQKYTFPSANVIRVHRIEYVPTGSSQVYPLKPSTINEMDQIWGVQQTVTQSYPLYYVLWGYPGSTITLKIQLYPTPSTGGTLNIFYYGLPTAMSALSDNVDIPEGWQDLVVMYAEYMCLRKGKDDRWQEAKSLYEDRLVSMLDVTREYHDQAHSIVTGLGAVPNWLYEFNE